MDRPRVSVTPVLQRGPTGIAFGLRADATTQIPRAVRESGAEAAYPVGQGSGECGSNAATAWVELRTAMSLEASAPV
jgi:hypothetical protein